MIGQPKAFLRLCFCMDTNNGRPITMKFIGITPANINMYILVIDIQGVQKVPCHFKLE